MNTTKKLIAFIIALEGAFSITFSAVTPSNVKAILAEMFVTNAGAFFFLILLGIESFTNK